MASESKEREQRRVSGSSRVEQQTRYYVKWGGEGGLSQAADNDQHHGSRWGLLSVSYFRGTNPHSL